jgi:surface antigen
MKRNLSTLAALLCLSLAVVPGARADCHGSTGGNEIVGTLLGAAIGGLVGSQIGGGTGNKVAIGAGVLAGGLLGNKLGNDLDCQDRNYHGAAAQDALENQRTGNSSTWENPDSGNEGSITPVRT